MSKRQQLFITNYVHFDDPNCQSQQTIIISSYLNNHIAYLFIFLLFLLLLLFTFTKNKMLTT